MVIGAKMKKISYILVRKPVFIAFPIKNNKIPNAISRLFFRISPEELNPTLRYKMGIIIAKAVPIETQIVTNLVVASPGKRRISVEKIRMHIEGKNFSF